ncbi:hypothetical protein BDR22DRAFT_850078 [Usnea florida]
MAQVRKDTISKYPITMILLAGVPPRMDAQDISDTLHGMNPRISTAVARYPNSEPIHDKGFGLEPYSGSKVCDPITILDDDEQDAADVNHIDLKNDDEAVVKGEHIDARKQFLAEYTISCLQRVATPHHLNDNTKVGGECDGGGSAQLADETSRGNLSTH